MRHCCSACIHPWRRFRKAERAQHNTQTGYLGWCWIFASINCRLPDGRGRKRILADENRYRQPLLSSSQAVSAASPRCPPYLLLLTLRGHPLYSSATHHLILLPPPFPELVQGSVLKKKPQVTTNAKAKAPPQLPQRWPSHPNTQSSSMTSTAMYSERGQ